MEMEESGHEKRDGKKVFLARFIQQAKIILLDACENDSLFVSYDSNEDDMVGINDTLTNILGSNCGILCIKKRCGCMV